MGVQKPPTAKIKTSILKDHINKKENGPKTSHSIEVFSRNLRDKDMHTAVHLRFGEY